MQKECSCGDSCPLCEKCDSPLCECYCDLEGDGETEKDEEDNNDEEGDEQDMW